MKCLLELKIERAKLILRKYLFFEKLLQQFTIILYKSETKTNKHCLYINAMEVIKYNIYNIAFLIAHELCHKYFFEEELFIKNKLLYNYYSDCKINDLLLESYFDKEKIKAPYYLNKHIKKDFNIEEAIKRRLQ